MKEKLKNEVSRDIIAFGSIPFFIIVLIRVYLLNKPDYFSQFLIAGLVFLILAFIFKIDRYSGLGLIVFIYTCLYYNDKVYSFFAFVLYILLVVSLLYLKKGKNNRKRILTGVILGGICAGISYYLINLIM